MLNHSFRYEVCRTLQWNAFSRNCSSILNDPLKPYNVLFLGSDSFAVTCLNRLKENADGKHNEEKVIKHLEVVCPPRSDTAVRKYAKTHSLPTHTWPVVLPPKKFDVGVVVSFGKLMPSSLIKMFPHGMINVHGSILPALRGAAPIARAIENGYKTTGVTVMKIAPEKFDHGFILDRSCEIPINEDSTAQVVSEVLANVGADLCLKTLQNLPFKLSNARAQDPSGVTYARKITIQDTYIDWEKFDARTIINKFRAYGYIKQFYLRCRHGQISIKLADLALFSEQNLSPCYNATKPGQVSFHKSSKTIVIGCKDGFIKCSRLIVSNRSPITGVDFYNGFMQAAIKNGKEIRFESMKVG